MFALSAGTFFRRLCRTVNTRNSSICVYRLRTESRPIAVLSSRRCLHHCFPSISFHLTLNKTSPYNKCFREFRLSSPRYVSPFVWLFIRPALKILALITGRGFRKWWKSLPPNKKKHFIRVMKKNKLKIFTGISIVSLLSCVYYYVHLEEVPITKRKRFMAFNSDQIKEIGNIELQETLDKFEKRAIPNYHPYVRRVNFVVNQIIQGNKDIKELQRKSFTVHVINDAMENAFVLPNGEIFVFAGMLHLCSNNDQLGVVLAHEISHCILSHGAENFSFVHLLDFLMIFLIGLIWAILPSDIFSVVVHWLARQAVDLLFQLPYNRKIETEADEVGLALAARACFDVRESSAFWAKMDVLKNNFPHGSQEVEFLSTHPSHKTRASHLDSLMEKALKLRSDCGCPMLKSRDPRREIDLLVKQLEKQRQIYRHQPVIIIPPMR